MMDNLSLIVTFFEHLFYPHKSHLQVIGNDTQYSLNG